MKKLLVGALGLMVAASLVAGCGGGTFDSGT